MKKKFKAKVSGMFDIVQLGDDTFSEVVDKLKANDYHIDQQFTSREECYRSHRRQRYEVRIPWGYGVHGRDGRVIYHVGETVQCNV